MRTDVLRIIDLGRLPYRVAYERQLEHLDEVLAGRGSDGPAHVGRLLLVEHDPPVITVSRRPEARKHLVATDEQLAGAGVHVEETDRGGDITYHGPGQLVVYPILDLNALSLNLHAYMRFLEGVVIDVCAAFEINAGRDEEATGVWVAPSDDAHAGARKICAIGVRVRKWITMHGLALNVATNLEHFDLIVPCGLAGRAVTSMQQELGDRRPTMQDVKAAMVAAFESAISDRLHR